MWRRILKSCRRYGEAAGEVISLLGARRRWWLLPLLSVLLLVGAFIFLTEASALSPLIYALF